MLALAIVPLAAPAVADPLPVATPVDAELKAVAHCVDQASKQLRGQIQAWTDTVGASWLGQTVTANFQSLKCKLHEHAPIVISGADPRIQNKAPGATMPDLGITGGAGTAGDPYLISGWNIAGSDDITVYTPVTSPQKQTLRQWNQQYAEGIRITGSTAYFRIVGVYVHGFPTQGIYVQGAHVDLYNSLILDTAVGLRHYETYRHPAVAHNTIIARNVGIDYGSHTSSDTWDNHIYVQHTSGTTYGVRVYFSSNHQINENNVDGWFSRDPNYGVYLDQTYAVDVHNDRVCAYTAAVTDFAPRTSEGVNSIWGTVACDPNLYDDILP